jgi:hypothetical protein
MPPWLSRRQQAQRWNVTKRSVERWGKDKKVGLPQEYEVNGRKYRDLPEIEIWERSCAVSAAANLAAPRNKFFKPDLSGFA